MLSSALAKMANVNPTIQPLVSWWPHVRRDELHIDTVLASDVDRFCRSAAKAGRKVVLITPPAHDKNTIFAHLQEALGLPDSVTNLDALWDVLTDDDFRPSARHIVLFDASHATDTDGEELNKVLGVFAEARDEQPTDDSRLSATMNTAHATFDVVTTVGRNHV